MTAFYEFHASPQMQSRASPLSRRFIQQHGQTRDRTPLMLRHQQMRTLLSPSKTLSTAWSRRPR